MDGVFELTDTEISQHDAWWHVKLDCGVIEQQVMWLCSAYFIRRWVQNSSDESAGGKQINSTCAFVLVLSVSSVLLL